VATCSRLHCARWSAPQPFPALSPASPQTSVWDWQEAYRRHVRHRWGGGKPAPKPTGDVYQGMLTSGVQPVFTADMKCVYAHRGTCVPARQHNTTDDGRMTSSKRVERDNKLETTRPPSFICRRKSLQYINNRVKSYRTVVIVTCCRYSRAADVVSCRRITVTAGCRFAADTTSVYNSCTGIARYLCARTPARKHSVC
jgi:hypothetical protein